MVRLYFGRSTIASFLIIQLTIVTFFFLNQKNNVPSPEKVPDKAHILILSTWRSGSTIVGQIFSQHPDVFYLMEPGWHVWMNMRKSRYNILQASIRDLLRSIFQCDMSAYDFYLPDPKKKQYLFMWKFSRALCTPPACDAFQRTDITSADHCRTLCANTNFSKVEETCKTYSHVALKEVRLFSFKTLHPLLTDPKLNLRVIHLIRDPRAVFHSREQGWASLFADNDIMWNAYNSTKYDKYKVFEDICRSQLRIYREATKELSSFSNRYMMIRFEDLVRDPIKKVKEMYEFVNLKMTPHLMEWILKMTRGKGVGDKDQAFDITSRNAVNVSQAWRYKLPFQTVKDVQNLCKELMSVMGYQHVKSENQQRALKHDLTLGINNADENQETINFWW